MHSNHECPTDLNARSFHARPNRDRHSWRRSSRRALLAFRMIGWTPWKDDSEDPFGGPRSRFASKEAWRAWNDAESRRVHGFLLILFWVNLYVVGAGGLLLDVDVDLLAVILVVTSAAWFAGMIVAIQVWLVLQRPRLGAGALDGVGRRVRDPDGARSADGVP